MGVKKTAKSFINKAKKAIELRKINKERKKKGYTPVTSISYGGGGKHTKYKGGHSSFEPLSSREPGGWKGPRDKNAPRVKNNAPRDARDVKRGTRRALPNLVDQKSAGPRKKDNSGLTLREKLQRLRERRKKSKK